MAALLLFAIFVVGWGGEEWDGEMMYLFILFEGIEIRIWIDAVIPGFMPLCIGCAGET